MHLSNCIYFNIILRIKFKNLSKPNQKNKSDETERFYDLISCKYTFWKELARIKLHTNVGTYKNICKWPQKLASFSKAIVEIAKNNDSNGQPPPVKANLIFEMQADFVLGFSYFYNIAINTKPHTTITIGTAWNHIIDYILRKNSSNFIVRVNFHAFFGIDK